LILALRIWLDKLNCDDCPIEAREVEPSKNFPRQKNYSQMERRCERRCDHRPGSQFVKRVLAFSRLRRSARSTRLSFQLAARKRFACWNSAGRAGCSPFSFRLGTHEIPTQERSDAATSREKASARTGPRGVPRTSLRRSLRHELENAVDRRDEKWSESRELAPHGDLDERSRFLQRHKREEGGRSASARKVNAGRLVI